ncbi:YceG family protein [Bacillus sp. DTU_2020_1000418_1_SI_GHA_SEK_038]|uniref:YceG family protein n=1 Tax=Bacillus sp. DTU_2020_1000418_1_SI_GHA_SEK_038 TaxID=3077585 RepID=UPI0028E34582|nr:YceG family protein [Bacillus sp. DTU_2020_1000418_1_SI_GHA_SEK_038]WNS73916.1 YceG family protein [Bacillus sp. DTU_2020_1000418_1_SI_GHA_SEK_038]
MNHSYNQIKTHLLPVSNDNWFSTLKKLLRERPQFSIEDGTIHFGQVVVRFLGVPLDEDEYYNRLYDLIHTEKADLILISEEALDKSIDNHHFQAIQKVLNINRDQKLSINRFVAFLDGELLLLKSNIPSLHRKTREAMISVLQLFSTEEPEGLNSQELRRVLVDVIKWSFNHLGQIWNNIELEKAMPKFLWYGETNKSHKYFLYYLMNLGCDLVSFSPSGSDWLAGWNEGQEGTFVHSYPERKQPERFPTEKSRRSATVAYRASREIESILNHEGSGLYKPWQLRDYTPLSVTLKTTYDELFILIKEKAMVRPNFEVKNGQVKIPSIFAKVQGVSKNRKEYWDRLQSISEYDHSLLIRRFPFTNNVNNDFRFHYRNALGNDGLLDTHKMVTAHYWKYQHLPTGLQNGIATAIRNICYRPYIKPIHHEGMEELKTYLFTQGMQIPASVLQLLQKFDYSQDVPKLILYNNELNGTMTRTDAALLLLLNQFGIDIVLYNPPGHNDLENFIEDGLYDVHWLEDVVFEQEFKEPSILKKVKGILKNLRGD